MYKSAVIPALALLSACAAPPLANNAQDQAELNAELAGLVPGRPLQCVPGIRTDDIRAVGEHTILIRDGSTVYRSETNGSCAASRRLGTTMVIKKVGTIRSCQGDIAQVVDLQSRAFYGSCTFGEFIPYRRS